MQWTKAKIYTTTIAIDSVVGMLISVGINGVEILDKDDFNDFLSDTDIYKDYIDDDLMKLSNCETAITFYLPQTPQGTDMLADIKGRINTLLSRTDIDFGRLALELDDIEEEQWENAWKRYFHPTTIGKRLVVCPSWEDADLTAEQVKIIIDPGMAFGTGQHETTRLCMEFLEKHVTTGMSILDVGCGSGILAVCGALLGADPAKGFDIDEGAVGIAKKNAEINGVSDKTDFYSGTLDTLTGKLGKKADIICMNIVADVIISLLDDIKSYMTEDTILLLSGIIDEREDDVLSALKEKSFSVNSNLKQGGWVALDVRCNG